jgi:hypothetical protein
MQSLDGIHIGLRLIARGPTFYFSLATPGEAIYRPAHS